MPEKKETKLLTYKGKPLVRKDNTVYYGNMSDKYVVLLQIMDTKKFQDIEIANRVLVQLMYTDPDISIRDRIIKKSEKKGFFTALDLGAVWLERELNKNS